MFLLSGESYTDRRTKTRRRNMPTGRRSFLSRLVRALPVVLAAAPGVIEAVQQARRALRDPAPRQEPALPQG
jgi:hypothetical protein